MTTTATVSNTQTVQDIYAAFARGDVPAIKDKVADVVDWGLGLDRAIRGDAGGFLGNWQTRDGVDEYFAHAAEELEFHGFAATHIVADGDLVLSRLELDVTGRRTGRRVQLGEVHEFTFGPDGKIVRYRPYIDTATLLSVLR